MFKVAIFIVAKYWENSNVPQKMNRYNILWYVHKMEYNSTIKNYQNTQEYAWISKTCWAKENTSMIAWYEERRHWLGGAMKGCCGDRNIWNIEQSILDCCDGYVEICI